MSDFLKNFSLTSHNTFGLNTLASYYKEFSGVEDLVSTVSGCRDLGLRWFVLGGGSNVIFDGDFNGVVLHSSSTGIECEGADLVIADSGVVWDDLVGWSVERGLGGLENLSYIPGTVGASPIQNIGAYGVEAGDRIEWVEYLDTDLMTVCRLSGSECEFGYRDSIFKRSLRGRAIVTRVAFRLSKNPVFNVDYGDVAAKVREMGGESLSNIRTAITEIRKSKLPEPSELGNAGSFFKNPVVDNHTFEMVKAKYPDVKWFDAGEGRKKIPAGWLIEKSGWKGRRVDSVGVHERQALVIVNYGGATANDILRLSEAIQRDIFVQFGIEIEREVNVIR